jgi:hypothetical protein
MKILNFSTIIPLAGLNRENDIILKLQDYLSKKYGYEFMVAKSLPYRNKFLARISKKWEKYYEYQQKGMIINHGYKTFIYHWLAPPSRNFWLYYLCLPIIWLWFKYHNQGKLSILAEDTDKILAQLLIPDGLYAYWIYHKSGKPYILNIRGDVNKYIRFLPVIKSIFNNASSIITHSPTYYSLFKNYINLRF